MDISSLRNADLGNLIDSSLILWNDGLSMYNTIYIFLKFTCPKSLKVVNNALLLGFDDL